MGYDMKPRQLRKTFKNYYRYGTYTKYHMIKKTCRKLKYEKQNIHKKMDEE